MATEKVWEQKEGTWSLRKNPNKKQEKSPDFVGQICIQGVVYELSGWNKVAASGAHWMSGTCKPPYATQPAAPAKKADDSDIPW